MKADNEKYCQECGQIINIKAEICPKCGVRQGFSGSGNSIGSEDSKWLITLLLCFFLGWLGIHRFYTGHTVIGVVQLITGGGCGIWWFIDFILIIIGSYKDSNGLPLRK